jgi:hypothetical protein
MYKGQFFLKIDENPRDSLQSTFGEQVYNNWQHLSIL